MFKWILLFLSHSLFAVTPASLDLEEQAKDYIVENKQIRIPDHPTACNASIVRLDTICL